MSVVKKYLSLIKFSHTIFAMPFAMIGFALGLRLLPFFTFNFFRSSTPGWHVTIFDHMPITIGDILIRLLLVVACMVFARSAAMAFNRYIDRKFDAKNPRTAGR